jgi:hypothetical protein
VASWLVSFAAGLIAVLLAMDLAAQGERATGAQVPVSPAPEAVQSAPSARA